MNKKKIITFIVLAYGISWLIWIPNVLAFNFDVPWEFNRWWHIVGGLGPFLGALITTFLFEKNTGVAGYFKDKLLRIQSLKWTAIGIGMPVLLFLIAMIVIGIFMGDWIVLKDLGLNSKIPVTNPFLIWLLWCFFYGFGEEGGWRGLLFPELTKGMPARTATLYVALVWAPWHLPVFFYDKDLSTMGLFLTIGWALGLLFGSLVMGWLVTQARYNLWPVIFWHGTFNFFTTSDRINPAVPGVMSFLVIIAALWIARRYGENLTI